jgi:hypothetical protein
LEKEKMKSIKYTLAALALIATASFNTAKAQAVGDVLLGVFNTTNSLQFDLGAYSTLSNGEEWDLGNVTGTIGDTSGDLTFDIAAAAGNSGASGGLAKSNIAITGSVFNTPTPTITSENTAIATVATNFTQGTTETPESDDHSYLENLQSASTGGSFAYEYGSSQFGFGSNYTLGQSWTGNDSAELALLVKNNSAPQLGTFTTETVDNDTVLTYDTLSVPEPSAYALGLAALALFWVLKRRSSTVA